MDLNDGDNAEWDDANNDLNYDPSQPYRFDDANLRNYINKRAGFGTANNKSDTNAKVNANVKATTTTTATPTVTEDDEWFWKLSRKHSTQNQIQKEKERRRRHVVRFQYSNRTRALNKKRKAIVNALAKSSSTCRAKDQTEAQIIGMLGWKEGRQLVRLNEENGKRW